MSARVLHTCGSMREEPSVMEVKEEVKEEEEEEEKKKKKKGEGVARGGGGPCNKKEPTYLLHRNWISYPAAPRHRYVSGLLSPSGSELRFSEKPQSSC